MKFCDLWRQMFFDVITWYPMFLSFSSAGKFALVGRQIFTKFSANQKRVPDFKKYSLKGFKKCSFSDSFFPFWSYDLVSKRSTVPTWTYRLISLIWSKEQFSIIKKLNHMKIKIHQKMLRFLWNDSYRQDLKKCYQSV